MTWESCACSARQQDAQPKREREKNIMTETYVYNIKEFLDADTAEKVDALESICEVIYSYDEACPYLDTPDIIYSERDYWTGLNRIWYASDKTDVPSTRTLLAEEIRREEDGDDGLSIGLFLRAREKMINYINSPRV